MKNFFTSLTLFLLVTLCTKLSAQWTDDTDVNTLVTDSTFHKEEPYFMDDNNGGYFVVWSESHGGWIMSDIYAQHVDADGNQLWGAGGVLVFTEDYLQTKPVVVLDNEGGIFIAWTDNRDSNGGNNYKPAIARLDGDGNVLWTFLLQEEANYNYQTQSFPIHMISDEAGGVFVCWNTLMPLQNNDVLMQRIDAGGNLLWDENLNLTPIADSQTESQLVSDGNGGCYVGWVDTRNDHPDFYVQHVTADGNILWAENGIPLVMEDNNTNFDYRFMSCGEQGAYLVYGRKIGNVSESDIYAQRMNPDGEGMWGEVGVSVCSAIDFQTELEATTDANNNLLVVWEDARETENNFDDLYTQKLNPAGEVQWSTDGVLAIEGEFSGLILAAIATDGQGGAIVSGINMDVLDDGVAQVQVVNITSAGLLNGEVKNVTTGEGWYRNYNRMLFTTPGQSISLFTRGVSTSDELLCIQKTSFELYSAVEESTTENELQLWPIPCEDVLNIRCNSHENLIQVFDYMGRNVLEISRSTSIDISGLSAGVYTLKSGSQHSRFVNR